MNSKTIGIFFNSNRNFKNNNKPEMIAENNLALDYINWIKHYETNLEKIKEQKILSNTLLYKPKFLLIIQVHNPLSIWLNHNILSIYNQSYNNYDICFINYCHEYDNRDLIRQVSGLIHHINIISTSDPDDLCRKINYHYNTYKCNYASIISQDDIIAPFALFEIAKALNNNQLLDLIYSDYDFIDDEMNRSNPFYKPGWSPDFLLSENYINNLTVFNCKLFDCAKIYVENNEIDTWSLYLQYITNAKNIYHISKILYHYRKNVEFPRKNKKLNNSQISATESYLNHEGLLNINVSEDAIGKIHVKWSYDKERVSIIIPTQGATDWLKKCVNSILSKTNYQNIEILIINNGNKTPDYYSYFQEIKQLPEIRILHWKDEFSYPSINNYAVNFATGKYLLFLNDDTEIISENWLEELVMWCSWEKIGAVGPILLKPNNTIQHAGVIIGLSGFAGHIFSGASESHKGIFGEIDCYRNYSALTSACLIIRKNLFIKIGGFNEQFKINGSDVELCIRLIDAGYRLVVNPFIKVRHSESATVKGRIPFEDFLNSFLYYNRFLLGGDDQFNPNLSNWSLIPRLINKTEEKPFISSLKFITSNISLNDVRDPEIINYSKESWGISEWLDASNNQILLSKNIQNENTKAINVQSISWFLPSFENPYYGGIYTILRFANFFKTEKGIQSQFLIINQSDTKKIAFNIGRAFQSLSDSLVINVNFDQNWDEIKNTDISIATSWATAYFALRFNRVRRKFYFIQDYEPLFFPAGSGFGMSEATYRFGFYGIANTPSIKNLYENDYGGHAEFFLPNIDPQIFHPDNRKSLCNSNDIFQIFFYGRPEHPRNGFELGIAALKKLKNELGNRLIIYSAGADWNPKHFGLDNTIINLGILKLEQSAQLYRNCDAGLIMMFTKHPSYLPFELMACGCLVVSNTNSSTAWFLKDQLNCLLAEATPSSIAEKVLFGLEDIEQRRKIRYYSLDLINEKYSDWNSQFEKIYQFMISKKPISK